ncbi:hypothetical protein [Spirosoma spitsbergense]|uniref:hypothetical protein n=1 Tax=Spirosoma spitsbergense TaxID=431554 RepID=UPI00036B2C8A|nr:hypothetical protein [Spirosoma spitsbergense]
MTNNDAYDPYEGATQFQSNQQNQPNQQSMDAETPDKSLNNDQKKAIIAAGVGTAALGAAAYGLSMLEDNENRDLADGDDTDEGDGTGDGSDNSKSSLASAIPITSPPVAIPTQPVDPFAGLTGFDKAFHEARLAMGGGGHTFQYEGQTYNTYTREEEANLTPDERNAFLASNNLINTGHGHHDSGTAIAATDPDHFPSVTLDHDAPSESSHEPSVSIESDEDASVSLDSDHDLHHVHMADTVTDPVATLDDHDISIHDLHDPLHDYDNHADVSDFT